MKILHVIASVNPADGGPVEGIVRQDEVTRHIGVREVATLDLPSDAWVHDFPMKVHALGEGRATKGILGRYGYAPKFTAWLRRHAADYDAVVVNGLWSFTSLGAARVLANSNVPHFLFVHGMMDPWFQRTYPFKHFVKQIFWSLFIGRLAASSGAVFFTTEEERLLARGQFFGHRYKEVVVGYGTVKPIAWNIGQDKAYRAAAPRLGQRKHFLFLSRIHPKKGCDMLIEAFASVASQYPDIDLVIAGPDSVGWGTKLKSLVDDFGLADRVHWTGPLYGDAKWGALYAADAFILPSHQENFGIAVAEALGCGTPVLISDKVNIWREIIEGDAGLVAPDTLEGTKQLLQGYLALPKEKKARMAEAAQLSFERHFDVAKSGPAFIDKIKSLVNWVRVSG